MVLQKLMRSWKRIFYALILLILSVSIIEQDLSCGQNTSVKAEDKNDRYELIY